MPDEIERIIDGLIPEFRVFARRVIEAGIKADRERVVAFIRSPDSVVPEFHHAERRPRSTSTGYGSVSPIVREALKELSTDSPEGVGAGEITAYFQRRGGGPTEKQVRAALKQLHNTGDAIRAARGRYLGRQEIDARDEPGVSAPGPVNLLESMAAE